MMTHERLYLIGPRGSGKSTVGRLLAERLGWGFADADEVLETLAGCTIADIFRAEGEAGFREREADILRELAKRERHVIACGGGVILRPANRALLHSTGHCVWLTGDPKILCERLECDPSTGSRRPALTDLPGPAEIERILRRARTVLPRGGSFDRRHRRPVPGRHCFRYLERMANLAIHLPVILWTAWTFILGVSIGSLLNVCIARLPLEKSIVWPSSRCGTCFQPIRWFDNIPLISYWLLRGRCRNCGARFSIRYFLVELGTGLGFAGLFYLEIVANIHDLPFFRNQEWNIRAGWVPWQAWVFFGQHAMLLSLLIVAAACDLNGRVIPLSVTMFGTGIGLLMAVLFPWPWPNTVDMPGIMLPPQADWCLVPPGRGLYPWPVWGPPPAWMPGGSHLLGLATGLAGILVGTWMLRGVRAVFTRGLGQEALGLGDADLMMMAGTFWVGSRWSSPFSSERSCHSDSRSRNWSSIRTTRCRSARGWRPAPSSPGSAGDGSARRCRFCSSKRRFWSFASASPRASCS